MTDKTHQRREYVLRAVSAAVEFIGSASDTQLSRIVIENLKRARGYISLDYPGNARQDSAADPPAAEAASPDDLQG